MTKVALRGLAQRKLRAFVTMLAVLLGVAFIAGSYVLTDTINRSFDDIFDEAYAQLSAAFAPEFVSSVAPEPFETLTYTDGRPPETADEASIDESTADRESFSIGDTLRIAGPAGVKGYDIVGLQRLGSTSSGGGGRGCPPPRPRPAPTRCGRPGCPPRQAPGRPTASPRTSRTTSPSS